MNNHHRVASKALTIVTVGLLSGFISVGAHGTDYRIIDLGTLGGLTSEAYGINNAGEVVGGADTAQNQSHAFLYSQGLMTDLGTLGGLYSTAYGINSAGEVVGGADTAQNQSHAFLYSQGLMTDLGTLGGLYSTAYGINSAGEVVGSANTSGGADYAGAAHAFLYGDGQMIDLGTLGGERSGASAINNRGEVVGYAYSSVPGVYHAFTYSNGHMTDLGSLDGPYGLSGAKGVNNSGRVVGSSTYLPLYSISEDAFLYRDGKMSALGAVNGPFAVANCINDAGQAVGMYVISSGINSVANAFLYSKGQLINLNSLLPADSGWTLTSANAINDKGQIVGVGTINGQTRAFLMSPVPLQK